MDSVAVMLQAGVVFVCTVSAVLQEGFVRLQEAGRVSPSNKSKLLAKNLLLFASLTDLSGLVFNVLYIDILYSETEMKLH